MKSRLLAQRATRLWSSVLRGRAPLWEISAHCRQRRRSQIACEQSTPVARIFLSATSCNPIPLAKLALWRWLKKFLSYIKSDRAASMAEYALILEGLSSFDVQVIKPDGFRSVRGRGFGALARGSVDCRAAPAR